MINKLLMSVLFVLVVLAGCNKQEPPKITSEDVSAESGTLEIKNAWVRVSGKGMNTALFFDALNGTGTADTIISAECEAAELVEVHETYKTEGDMMGMRQVNFVAIPQNSTVQFKPRDLHVMLIKLKRDIQLGDTVSAAINFKKGGKISVRAIAKELMMNNTQK